MTATALLCLLLVEPADLVRQLRCDETAVRLRAVQQVERLGAEGSPDEVYLAPLAKLLADPEPQTRGLAALALSRHVVACQGKVPEGVVAPLLMALGDENPQLAAYCARALLSLGERVFPQLRAAQAADQPRAQRLAALEGCLRLAALPSCRESVEVSFWTGLDDDDQTVRNRAFALQQIVKVEHKLPEIQDAPLLAATLRTGDVFVRILAARHLAALEEKALPALLDLLDDRNPLVQEDVASLIARLLNRAVFPTSDQTAKMLRALERPDSAALNPLRSALRRVSAGPDVALDDPRFFPRLRLIVRLLPVPPPAPELADPLLRLASALALVPQPGDLFERLRSDDPAERLAAVQRIERLGAEGGSNPFYVPILASLLGDADQQTRGLAALALGYHRLAGNRHEPVFVSRALLRATGDRDPHVAALCRRALSIPDRFRADFLDSDLPAPVRETQLGRDALNWGFLIRLPDPEGRRNAAAALLRAARTLGPQVPDEVLEGLRWGCKSKDAVVRDVCTEGLAACGLRAAHTLCELLDDLSPDAHRCALVAVAKLVEGNHPIPAQTVAHLDRVLRSTNPELRRVARLALDEVNRQPRPKDPPP
jgi:HEAT repeat protein